MKHQKKLLAAMIGGALISGSALATNGYAPHGIGMKSKGMGGVNIAHQGDAVAVGGNPAGSAWMDNRVDLGVDIFKPDREAELKNTTFFDGTYDGNGSDLFAIPEFGYRRGLNNDLAFALSLFGNGGMNTDYKDGIPLFNFDQNTGQSARTGINLAQLFVVPSLSYKLNPNNSIGVGLNLVAQGFEAEGLGNFDNPFVSTDAGNVTGNDTSWAYGAGIRIGWMGKVSSTITLGATYQTKTYMSEFDDYSGLFAEGGDFDVPSNYGVGIAIQATPALLLSADVMRIKYSDVDSISNPSSNIFNCPAFAQQFGQPGDPSFCMGGDNGPGFGWDDMTVYKLGVEFAATPTFTLRAGYNRGESPISSSDTVFNILAPGVVEEHLTLGGTWTVNPTTEVTFAYMHAFENTVEGDPSPLANGGSADITMSQDSLGVAVSWKL